MKKPESVEILLGKVKGLAVPEVIKEAAEFLGPKNIALASSLSAEDQVITHIIRTKVPEIDIFTIDTGRLPQETYDLMQETMKIYAFRYSVLVPDADRLAELVGEYGPNLFYAGPELRKKCCEIRKVLPLKKKLSSLMAWICGLRREQGVTRTDIDVVEWDSENSLIKINPLAGWTEKEVWNYIKENDVPYNKLYNKGYTSIGCAPCTRAIKPGEDVRAGRWWWESPENKECGLHIKNGKVERKNDTA